MKFTHTLIFKILAVALAYYVAGVLALQLSLPPGFATSFWPSAGISLAAILVCGGAVWPGILLGAFFVNIIPQLANSSISWSIFFPAFIPAVGSALQALTGARLVKRFAGHPNSLNEERSIMMFLVFGGPVACTVSATIAVTTFCFFGLQPWSSFAFTWGTWWVGDSIGVMIVAPLLVLLMSDESDRLSRKNISILVPSLFVLSLSIFLYVKVSQWEQEKIENELKSKSNVISTALERQLAAYIEVLKSIEGLFASSKEIEKHEFRQFVKGPLSRYPGLHALSWDIKFKDSEKAAVLDRLARDGNRIELKEMDSEGRMIPARQMSEYLVPVFIEPIETNSMALGFNLFTNENRKKAALKAIRTGQPTATDRVRLVQDPEHQFGLLILLPIYENNKPISTPDEREAHARGVVAGVLQFKAFMSSTLIGYSMEGINFQVEDLSAPENERILFSTENFSAKAVSSRDLHWIYQFDFANREWRINFKKSYAALLENRPWQAWFVLATGLLFSGLFTAFLMVIIGRTSRIEDLVEKRTEELAEAKANMISTSKLSALGEMAGGMAHEINTPLTIINLKVAQIQNELSASPVNKEKVNDGLKKIEDTVARIAKIIRGLRYFARDTKSDPFIRVQVSAILEDTLYLCIERFRYNGIILKTADYPKNLYIDCRPTEISQVILNLLNNACDAVLELPEKWISIDVVKKGEMLEVRISDSGPGIPRDVQEKIMQPFFTTKPVGKGTGLGLSISKGIIDSHNGSLTIDNKSRNTCFVITLPIHQDPA
ncbi:MAG: hypothetical protein K0R29_1003 [Pseudobdellovibrio sp.]|nr:hypothetical protein [Pseudobdellovibrio sp.]